MPPQTCEHPFASNRLNEALDFRPEWDVPDVGRLISDALDHDIGAVRASPDPDPARKIHLIYGPAGYGKTHLFGRIQHRQGDQVCFVFVHAPCCPAGAAEDQVGAVESVRYQFVEALFHAVGETVSPIRRLLARFLRDWFVAYFDQLPPGLRTKCTAVRQALEDDALAVLEVVAPVTDPAPYHALAESFRARYPKLAGPVLRALVLGLSPAANDARTWLRGEADQVPEERLRLLRLGERSHDPLDVIRAVATLLQDLQVPLVLCLDQLD
jgi:hypothetical protein